MGQQSMRQFARGAALDVQGGTREGARRERRLDNLAVELHTALGERTGGRASERWAGEVLPAVTGEEGLTLREAVDWCGGLALREVGFSIGSWL